MKHSNSTRMAEHEHNQLMYNRFLSFCFTVCSEVKKCRNIGTKDNVTIIVLSINLKVCEAGFFFFLFNKKHLLFIIGYIISQCGGILSNEIQSHLFSSLFFFSKKRQNSFMHLFSFTTLPVFSSCLLFTLNSLWDKPVSLLFISVCWWFCIISLLPYLTLFSFLYLPPVILSSLSPCYSPSYLSPFCFKSLFPFLSFTYFTCFSSISMLTALSSSVCSSSPHQIYLLAPKSALGRFIKKPFIKFICHTASYLTFLFLLLLASQHIARTNLHMQGPPPTIVEWMILPWVLGMYA